jgi:uncharacterized protein
VKIFLDANLLIYLNTYDEMGKSAQGDPKDPLEVFYVELLKEDLYTDVLALDETIYLSLSKFRVPYSLSFEFLRTSILPYSSVISIEGSDISEMEKYLSKYKLKPSDAIHLAVMEKEGVTNIASEDAEFDKVHEVRRIWLKQKIH